MYSKWDALALEVSDSEEEDVVRIRRQQHESCRKISVESPKAFRFGLGITRRDATPLHEYSWEESKEQVVIRVKLPMCLRNEQVSLSIQFRSQSFNADVVHHDQQYRFAVTETFMEIIDDESRGFIRGDEIVIKLKKFARVSWDRLQR